ncbi:MAG: Ig-like domain repeat protein, partial [Acidobacteriota bacterium]
MTSAEGLTRGRRFELPVDRTPPSFEILFPAEGEAVCAERKTSGAPFLTIDTIALDGFPGADQLMKIPAAWPESSALNPLAYGVFLAGETLAGDGNLEAIAAETFGPVGPFELDLERLPGAVQLNTRMELIGLGGHRVCVPRSFSVDALADAVSVEPRSAIFSPNGDGVRDRAAFALEIPSEPLSAEARVEAGVLLEEPNGVPRCVTVTSDPEVVATLASSFSLPGLESLEWDGTTQSGAPAPAGCYYLVFDAQDACGNPSTSRFRVAVDRTPPALQILSPAPGPLAASFVEIAVSASDDFAFLTSDRPAVSVALSYGLGASPTEWFALQDPIWNAANLPPGEYTLRAIATDQAGNSTERRTVVLLDPQDLFTYFEPEPVLFSPNGDGRLDVSTARFGLSRPARVELVALRPDGALVRTLEDRELQRGSFLSPWDGLGDDGQPVPDGLYTLRLRGFEPGMGGTLSQEEALSVTVDATPPAWELVRPLAEGFLRAADQIEAAVTDLHLEEWTVSLASASEAPAFEEIGRGNGPAVALPVQLAEGRYRLRLEARDLAGNRSELRVPFTVDATAPVAEWLTPDAGSVHGPRVSPVALSGLALDENLDRVILEAARAEAPNAFTLIAEPQANAEGAFSAPWDVAALPDGEYVLRLRALDLAGFESESRRTVTLDATPPEIAITGPAPGDFVTGPVAIVGTATDPHLGFYEVEISPAGAGAFSVLLFGVDPVSGGALGTWQALPEDGAYDLRLIAEDAVRNRSEILVTGVQVDTEPPEPPANLEATPQGDGASLSWQPSPSSDVVAYRVYRDGIPIQEVPGQEVPVLTAIDPSLGEGSFVYTVTAIDRSGQESDPSNAAEVTVDRTPPEVRIF